MTDSRKMVSADKAWQFVNLPEESSCVFDYTPENWCEKKFLSLGGFVAVVLNYNKKGLISCAAESALKQDFPCYDVLMLDDCSSDGSEQEMLAVARDYARQAGECARVRVFFNQKNRTTIGQWHLAVRASNGLWFGMFCGDDTSRSNRIAVAAEFVLRYPTALGIGTNFMRSDGHCQYEDSEIGLWKGSDSYNQKEFPISGCAAWWHRSLLEKEMLPSNIDDYELYWYAKMLRKGLDIVSLVWDHRDVTVDYCLGTGVTTSEMMKVSTSKSFCIVRRWRCYQAIKRYFKRYLDQIEFALYSFARRYCAEDQFVQFDIAWRKSNWKKMYTYGFVGRIQFMWRNRKCLSSLHWKVFIKTFLGSFSYVVTTGIMDFRCRWQHRDRASVKS